MKHSITGTELENNIALLDAVGHLLGAHNDAALSRILGVMPPVISKIRHGYLPVGATMQLAMIDLGIPLGVIRQYVPRQERA